MLAACARTCSQVLLDGSLQQSRLHGEGIVLACGDHAHVGGHRHHACLPDRAVRLQSSQHMLAQIGLEASPEGQACHEPDVAVGDSDSTYSVLTKES